MEAIMKRHSVGQRPLVKKEKKSFFPTSHIQRKLTVGAANDPLEAEADAMADKVVQRSMSSERTMTHTGSLVQRKCAQCEEEESLQMKPLASQIMPIQRHTLGSAAAHQTTDAVSSQIENHRGGGQVMDDDTRGFMENSFGADFSSVRIHTDSTAVQLSRDLGAQAFTVGKDVFFNEGRYNPSSTAGKHLLAHELTHTLQQGAVQRKMVQRDFAIEPPNPEAEGAELSEEDMASAISFNEGVLNDIPDSAAMIGLLRDVLGISKEPAVIDEAFVNAVLDWQAMYGLTEDGMLGPRSAAPLFKEIGAEGQGTCEVDSGPRYNPTTTITATNNGSSKSAFFRLFANFKSDPANRVLPSCCEVRQLIRWNAAAAASFGPGRIPHAGFPAGHPADSWIEDRDNTVNNRYGHRSGRFSDPQSFDQYLDASGRRNQAFGHRYRGSDSPGGGVGLAGQWRFLIRVLDVCNGNRRVGTQDFLRINW